MLRTNESDTRVKRRVPDNIQMTPRGGIVHGSEAGRRLGQGITANNQQQTRHFKPIGRPAQYE